MGHLFSPTPSTLGGDNTWEIEDDYCMHTDNNGDDNGNFGYEQEDQVTCEPTPATCKFFSCANQGTGPVQVDSHWLQM